METQTKTESDRMKKGMKIQKITPFLWFDRQAEEAVNFYITAFRNSEIKTTTRYSSDGARASGMPENSVMTMAFQIEGKDFVAINGGPVFQINPTISFFVNCESVLEIDRLWKKLSVDGMVMMELDNYPFAEKYGWIQDKFGVSWQLILPEREQKIIPCFMFTGDQHKKAEEAIHFYTSIFKDSEIIQLERYGKEVGPEGAVVHCKFTLNGQEFIAMDSHENMGMNFNPAISMVVNCETQEEIDYYWEKLSEGGFEGAQQCGWLQDKFGVSWQIVPNVLGELLSKGGNVMQTMLQMKKLDIKMLQDAVNQ
ncbi:VOC family protein [Aquipluma nitroreducens]|nr:VOC family protein [Aquipluma nitroreducens]